MKLDTFLTVVLVICAVIITGTVIRRELLPASDGRLPEQRPTLIQGWQSDLHRGIYMGPLNAPVKVIEFADFECPFCGSFHKVLKSLRERYPSQVSLTYVHFPLPMHRFALPAARVAECAGDQGRFEAMYDQLFAGQEAFGLKPWGEYATAAGVADLPAFDTCVRRTDPVPRIEEGKELGKELDIRSTPTVILNGWKLGHPPSPEELDTMVKAVLAGRSPIDTKS